MRVGLAPPRLRRLAQLGAQLRKGGEEALDLSHKELYFGCAILLAPEIRANRSLASFTFSGDYVELSKPCTLKATDTEADFAGAYLGESGAILCAAFIPRCEYVSLTPG